MRRRVPKKARPPIESIDLGKLTVGEELGRGGFGAVYKATIEGIELPFAVKLLDPSPFNDRERAGVRFLAEAHLLFRLRHPSIVPIYGVGKHEQKTPYILMEYFDGVALKDARHNGVPTPEQVLNFVERIAQALSYAHSLNIIHRDINPANLMTRTGGEARVLDFGVATLLDPEGSRFTRTSEAVAGDAYTAPELNENPKLVDHRCDIYSLGACWYWLLTGQTPKGRNLESAFRTAVRTSVDYERVILRCLDKAEDRFQTAADLVSAVQALRLGRAPEHAAHEVTDSEARIMGVLVASAPDQFDEWTAFYKMEQEIGSRQSRLLTTISIKKLIDRALIEVSSQQDGYNDPYVVYRPTKEGFGWVTRYVNRVEDLLRPLPEEPQPKAPLDDDIPF